MLYNRLIHYFYIIILWKQHCSRKKTQAFPPRPQKTPEGLVLPQRPSMGLVDEHIPAFRSDAPIVVLFENGLTMSILPAASTELDFHFGLECPTGPPEPAPGLSLPGPGPRSVPVVPVDFFKNIFSFFFF